MLKFTASGNGRVLVGLGLEAANVERLQQGEPIRVALADLGFVGAVGAVEIMIFAGQDAASMQRDLAWFIGKDTVVREDPP